MKESFLSLGAEFLRRHIRYIERSPKLSHSPGFGTTASKISKWSLLQPSHKVSGTSQRKTLSSKKIHADGIMRPSDRSIPEGVIEDTCTGGGLSEAKKFVKAEGLRVSLTRWLA